MASPRLRPSKWEEKQKGNQGARDALPIGKREGDRETRIFEDLGRDFVRLLSCLHLLPPPERKIYFARRSEREGERASIEGAFELPACRINFSSPSVSRAGSCQEFSLE